MSNQKQDELTLEEKRELMSKARDICQQQGWTDSGDIGMCLSFNTGGNYHKWRAELEAAKKKDKKGIDKE